MRAYHYLNGHALQPWYFITIQWDGDSTKQVFFHSSIHRNQVVEIPPLFSADLSDSAILRDPDLLASIYSRYGTDIYYA